MVESFDFLRSDERGEGLQMSCGGFFHLDLGTAVTWIDIFELFFPLLHGSILFGRSYIERFGNMQYRPFARESQTEIIPARGLEVIGHFADGLAEHCGIDGYNLAEIKVIADRSELAVDQTVSLLGAVGV